MLFIATHRSLLFQDLSKQNKLKIKNKPPIRLILICKRRNNIENEMDEKFKFQPIHFAILLFGKAWIHLSPFCLGFQALEKDNSKFRPFDSRSVMVTILHLKKTSKTIITIYIQTNILTIGIVPLCLLFSHAFFRSMLILVTPREFFYFFFFYLFHGVDWDNIKDEDIKSECK